MFAELSDNEKLQSGLVYALEFQNTVSGDSINPIELMKEAVKRLIIDGHKEISSTHVVLEIENLVSNKPLAEFDENPKWKDPAWIGRQLRIHGLVEINSLPTRQMFFGKSVRVYPINKTYLNMVLKEHKDLSQHKASSSK